MEPDNEWVKSFCSNYTNPANFFDYKSKNTDSWLQKSTIHNGDFWSSSLVWKIAMVKRLDFVMITGVP